MSENSNAYLKSTGEPVVILVSDGADRRTGPATSGYTALPVVAAGARAPGANPVDTWRKTA